MGDVRLKTTEYEFDGKKFTLRCNMNVLAEVQEFFGGVILNALSEKATLRGCLAFLAAMLNDYADEMGWAERYTQKQVGRVLLPHQLDELTAVVFPLVTSALQGDEKPPEVEGKNAKATQKKATA